jgi:hypothetical protein
VLEALDLAVHYCTAMHTTGRQVAAPELFAAAGD